MKLLRVCQLFAILLAGCYSHTAVPKDGPLPPSTVEVSFRLRDGTHILSHEYQRLENGYHVVGKLVKNDNTQSEIFSGTVPDDHIKEVVTSEFDKVRTVSAVVATVIGIGVVFGLAVHSNMSR